MRLGIDFGTTRTVVALARDGRHPLVAFDAGGEFVEHVPGIAAIANGELVVGWEAAKALAAGEASATTVRVVPKSMPSRMKNYYCFSIAITSFVRGRR